MNMTKDRLHGKKTLKVTDFLDEFEKDDVKKYVDIVELFHHFGISLTKKGKGFMGKCPWHNDSNPSLSVDREKGVYNCFGCGESGDIFTLTEKMKGGDFKGALTFLKEWKGRTVSTSAADDRNSTDSGMDEREESISPSTTASRATHQVDDAQEKDVARDAAPGSPEALGSTLTAVADHYHRKLFEHEKALEYLKTRGITNPGLYARYKIGYADGSLLSMIGENQKRELRSIGILTEKGHEHFGNCLIIPIIDDLGQVVGMYGRSIDSSAKMAHLYLKGKHRGVFNRKASKVYDEIILAESIIDALSLVELGIENTQSLYGTNGFTEEHLTILKEDRVKTVILALDNDEPGREASERLKEKLLGEGFAVKVAPSPPAPLPLDGTGEGSVVNEVKDWNEYLIKGGTVEAVKEAFGKAETHRPAGEAAVSVSEDEMGLSFALGEVRYRVMGVKELFINNLRVHVRAECGVERYYDTLDLYSARSRANYAANLSKTFSIEPKRIEKDLIAILEHLEARRDRALRGEPRALDEMTAEERRLGMELLSDPRLFERIVEDMTSLGYAGEELNKQLIYLAASSRKLDDPISVLIVSASAAGKSFMVDTVKELLPPEEVLMLTSLSDQALNYAEELNGKFLSLGEAVHSESVEHQVREIISGKMISRLVTVKDPKTGKLKSTLVSSPAACSMVITGTRSDINPENASRFFIVNVDESREQTRRIYAIQSGEFRAEHLARRRVLLPEIIRAHRAAQRMLRPLFTSIEFSDEIGFPDQLTRGRRDRRRFLHLIAAVSYLRQYQKEIKTVDGFEYIDADFTDYEIARTVMMSGVLASTMRELPRGAIDLYEMLREMARKAAARDGLSPVEITFGQRDVREYTGYGQTWVKQNLRLLVEYEYLLLVSGGGARTKGRYRLRDDDPVKEADFSMIPTRAELEQRVFGQKK